MSEYETAEEGNGSSDDSFITAVEELEDGLNDTPTVSGRDFLCLEAGVSDDESAGESDDETSRESGDDYLEASFVDDSDIESSYSQIGRYLKSIQDVVEDEEATHTPNEANENDSQYSNDSFCDDNVQFEEVGEFSQAMIVAEDELSKEGGGRRRMRSESRALGKSGIKKWRRIITHDSDSD